MRGSRLSFVAAISGPSKGVARGGGRERHTDEIQEPRLWGSKAETKRRDARSGEEGEEWRTRGDECAVHAPNTAVDRFSEPRWKVGRAVCRWDNPG